MKNNQKITMIYLNFMNMFLFLNIYLGVLHKYVALQHPSQLTSFLWKFFLTANAVF